MTVLTRQLALYPGIFLACVHGIYINFPKPEIMLTLEDHSISNKPGVR